MLTHSGHLTYCTNIHAGENWKDHFNELKHYFPAIKKQLSPDALMGIGLRLSNKASLELIKGANLDIFQQWIKENEAYVFTMNGFPYGDFHHTSVKENVHIPDWTTNERVAYTLRLFKILEVLLPENMDGGISTSPMSYRRWFQSGNELNTAKKKSTENILSVVENLIDMQQATGKILHLDIEPEPDGLLETGAEFIQWFKRDLLPAGIKRIAAKYDVSTSKAEELIKVHVRLCYDVCHFAIGYEPHKEIIEKLLLAGIKIGKIQISAALKALLNGDTSYKKNIKESFTRFDEPTYLHQVVAKKKNGTLLRYPDLPVALADFDHPLVNEWRAHFHVPVFTEDFGSLQSTQKDIIEVLQIQKDKKFTQHLEVETYTWEVLSPSLKLPLRESIIRELQWVQQNL